MGFMIVDGTGHSDHGKVNQQNLQGAIEGGGKSDNLIKELPPSGVEETFFLGRDGWEKDTGSKHTVYEYYSPDGALLQRYAKYGTTEELQTLDWGQVKKAIASGAP